MNRYSKYSDQQETPLIQIHPYKLGLFLLLAGLSMLFVGFSVAYVYTRTQNGVNGVQLPPIFILNSLILIASSLTIHQANQAYRKDHTHNYQKALWATLLLTLAFLLAQIAAWTVFKTELLGENIGNGHQYLYAISGLHFAHVLGGLPFLGLFIYTANRRMKEPVSVLVYFSDPQKRTKLQLLTIYWHFLDALWLFLIGFFGINMLL